MLFQYVSLLILVLLLRLLLFFLLPRSIFQFECGRVSDQEKHVEGDSNDL